MNESFVPLTVAYGQTAGEMLRAFFEAQGFRVRLSQESAGVAMGFTIGALGEVELLVDETQLADALVLLEELNAGKYEDTSLSNDDLTQQDAEDFPEEGDL